MRGVTATAIFRPRGDFGRFVEARIGPAVLMATEESINMIFDRSQQLVAVRTGELKASGKVTIEQTGKTVVGKMEYTAEHAPYVEYGTGIAGAASEGAGEGPYSTTWPGMVAQPFVRPALDESKPKIKDIFANDVGLAIK